MSTNFTLHKIISTSSTVTKKRHSIKESQTYQKTQLYRDKSVDVINHTDSKTFYTDEYVKLLESLLGDPDLFRKKSQYNRKIIQEDILFLSEDDYTLKTYLHKSVNEVNNFHTIFPSEFNRFRILLSKLRSHKFPGQRGYMNKPSFKLTRYIKRVYEILESKGLSIKELSSFTEEDAIKLQEQYLTAQVLFNKASTVFVKVARDRMFNSTRKNYDEKALYVYNHEALYKLIDHILLVSVIDAVVLKISSKKIVKPLDAIVRTVKVTMISHKSILLNDSIVKLYKDHIKSVLSCYTESGLFKDVEKSTKNNRTQIKFRLPSVLSNTIGKYTIPPRIVKPEKVNYSNLREYLIPSQTTSVKITPSQDLIDSLNTSNSKRFRINDTYLHILKELDIIDLQVNYPVPQFRHIRKIERRMELFDDSFSNFRVELLNRLQNSLVNYKLNLTTPFQYRYVTNMTVFEARAAHELHKLGDKKSESMLSRKAGLTRMTLADILSGFPLYYTNKLCTTTRQFAYEYLISRHIGCLKLLRCEFTPKTVSKSGLIYMMEAYYCDDKDKLLKFKNYVLSNPTSNRHIKKFYEDNRIDYASKESLTHFLLLSAELQKVFSTKKTSILLQLDQVASGLVFMSLLFKNKALAKQCYIIENEDCVGAYTFAQNNFKSFFEREIKCKNSYVLDLFVNDRKIHKYALMCYSYKQTSFGRSQDFTERWKQVYGVDPSKEEWRSLNEVSIKYPVFVDSLFSGLNSQILVLDKILTLVAHNSGSVRIRSIDGDIIEWSFYDTEVNVRKALNPVKMNTESYKFHTLKLDEHSNPVIDLKQFRVKFLSYVVHSVDASVMRRLVNLMYREYDYKIDQLHDCIMVHPNQVDNLYKCLDSIYNSKELITFMSENVFKTFMESVSIDKKAELQLLIEEFNAYNDNDLEDILKVDVRQMYTFED